MNNEVFVLRMDGCNDQLILAQSKKELAFRLYGLKIEKPAQQMFLDPKASIIHLGTYDELNTRFIPAEHSFQLTLETVQSYLDLASESMMKRAEVLPNE